MSRPLDLVLASASPRRRELLAGLGIRFQVRPVELDETPIDGEDAQSYVLRLAEEKASAEALGGELVLSADTIVSIDGQLLGKPESDREARAMLTLLAGRLHQVATGVALVDPDRDRRAASVTLTEVRFCPMEPEEIDWYLSTGEPRGKAGAYAIQGLGAMFVEELKGNYSNVVGLPLTATYRLFRRLGYDLRDFRGA